MTGAFGGDATDLPTRRSAPRGRLRLAGVLPVAVIERVVGGVHSNTTYAQPFDTVRFRFVVLLSCFDRRLSRAAATSDDADDGSAVGVEAPDLTRRELHDSNLTVVREQLRTRAGGADELPVVTGLMFDATGGNILGNLGE